jgi:hypothetical protein
MPAQTRLPGTASPSTRKMMAASALRTAAHLRRRRHHRHLRRSRKKSSTCWAPSCASFPSSSRWWWDCSETPARERGNDGAPTSMQGKQKCVCEMNALALCCASCCSLLVLMRVGVAPGLGVCCCGLVRVYEAGSPLSLPAFAFDRVLCLIITYDAVLSSDTQAHPRLLASS